MSTTLRTARSLTSRLVISAGLWATCVLGAGGLLLAGVFADVVEHNFDARLQADLENLVAAVDSPRPAGLALGRPLGDPRYERAYSGWYWQIRSATGESLRSRSLWDAELPALPTATDSPITLRGPNDEPVRLFTSLISLPGHERNQRGQRAFQSRPLRSTRCLGRRIAGRSGGSSPLRAAAVA